MEIPKRVSEMLQENERALPVAGYDGDYWVTDQGRVISLKCRKAIALAWGFNPEGYPHIALCRPGEQKTTKIHKLVTEAFLGPCPEDLQVRHMDGDPSNACLDNLVYGTASENERDKVRHGTSNRGERSGLSKFTKKEVIEIRRKYATGLYFQKDLAEEYGTSQAYISELVNGRKWAHLPQELP